MILSPILRSPKLLLLLLSIVAILFAPQHSLAQVVLSTGTPNVDSFPIVRIPVSVTESSKPATDVTVANFAVRQDGTPVTNLQLVECTGSPSAAICFVVDTSQSMETNVSSGPANKPNYQKFLNGFSAFISSVPAPSQIALVEFAQYATAWPGPSRWFFYTSTVDTTEFLIDLAAGFPAALGGWTNLDSAISIGAQVLSHSNNPRKILVVVSDDAPGFGTAQLLASQGITAYFMDVERHRSPSQPNQPAKYMTETTGGQYYSAADTLSYTPTMLAISQSIFAEHCTLRYVSPDPCPWWKQHLVQINLNYKTAQLSNAYPFALGGTRVDKTAPTFKIDSTQPTVRYLTAYDPFPCESGMWTLKDSLLKNFRRVTQSVVTSDSARDSLLVIDTMANADAWYIATDSSGNVQTIHVQYSPPADILPPVFSNAIWAGNGVNTMDVTEQRPWDRRLISVSLAPGAVNLVLDSVHFYTKQYARAYLRILNMKDSAGGCLIASDSFTNTSQGCFTYAGAGRDIVKPQFAQDPIAIPRGVMTGIVTEKRAGDQGIKTVKLTPVSNSVNPATTFVSFDQSNVRATIVDTMFAARTQVEVWDSTGNYLNDTLRYDPEVDTYFPVIAHSAVGGQIFDFQIAEGKAWDRGIRLVQFLPTSTNSTAASPVFTSPLKASLTATVTNSTQDAMMIVAATDSIGHVSYDTARYLASAPPQALNPLGDSVLDFGSLILPGSGQRNLTFTNANDSAVTVSLTAISGSDSVFALTSASTISIAPRATAILSFDYHPRWIGNWTESMEILRGAQHFGSVTLKGQSTATFNVAFDKVHVPHVGDNGVLTMSLDAPVKPINLDNVQITVKYDPNFISLGDPLNCVGSLDTGICLYDANWTGGIDGDRVMTMSRKDTKLASSLSFDRSQIRIPFKTIVAPVDTTLIQATTGTATLAAMLTSTDGMITAGDTCGASLFRSVMNGELEVRIIGVHPNPASSSIELRLHSSQGGATTVTFFSMLGQQVRSVPLHLAQGDQTVSIVNLPEQSGVYELVISAGGSVVRRRIEILK